MVSRGEDARTKILEQLSRISGRLVSDVIEDSDASSEISSPLQVSDKSI